jgi:hypothetical protein
MKECLKQIRITKETKDTIDALSKILKLKQITVLEYLIKGKIDYAKYKHDE